MEIGLRFLFFFISLRNCSRQAGGIFSRGSSAVPVASPPTPPATQLQKASVLRTGVVGAGSWEQRGGCGPQAGGGVLSWQRSTVTPSREVRGWH